MSDTVIVDPNATNGTFVQKINNTNEVVGYYAYNGQFGRQGFAYNSGTYSENYPSGTLEPVSDVNDSGTIVGQDNYNGYINGTYVSQAGYVDNNGSYTTIAPSYAFSVSDLYINSLGEVAGDATYNNFGAGFVYQNGVYDTIAAPGATFTYVHGINASGQVVVNSDVGAFVYTPSLVSSGTGSFVSIIYPGAANSVLTGINNEGIAIGTYQTTGSSPTYSFEYNSITGAYTNIVDPANGAVSTEVAAINSLGQIAGTYTGSDGATHGFIDTNGSFVNFDADVTGAAPGSTTVTDINDAGVVVGTFLGPNLTTESFVTCFCPGTRIRLLRGGAVADVDVERVRIGDFAVTADRTVRSVVWIGHRNVACHARPDLHPVRILAHAFGDNLPVRDVLLSPGHPVLVGADADNNGGYLVPIMCLVNGTSVARAAVAEVTYWHVELDTHDILLAEGLPAESYLDWGDRTFFTEGADHALANPDFVVPGLGHRCRPVALDGPAVEAERRRLDAMFEASLIAQCAWPAVGHEGDRFACGRRDSMVF